MPTGIFKSTQMAFYSLFNLILNQNFEIIIAWKKKIMVQKLEGYNPITITIVELEKIFDFL